MTAAAVKGESWAAAVGRVWAGWLISPLAVIERAFRAGAEAQAGGKPAESCPHLPVAEVSLGDRELDAAWRAGWEWRSANPEGYLPKEPLYVEPEALLRRAGGSSRASRRRDGEGARPAGPRRAARRELGAGCSHGKGRL